MRLLPALTGQVAPRSLIVGARATGQSQLPLVPPVKPGDGRIEGLIACTTHRIPGPDPKPNSLPCPRT